MIAYFQTLFEVNWVSLVAAIALVVLVSVACAVRGGE
jgi:hypothetical protein